MKNILIIDDNPSDILIAKKVCESIGFLTDTAHEGFSGLELSTRKKYNLIIIDLQMPHMSGIQLLNRLKHQKISEQIPILIMSSKNQEHDIKKTLELGALDYIVKPIDPMIFKNKVIKLTQMKSTDWTYYELPENPDLQHSQIKIDILLQKISEVGVYILSPFPLETSNFTEIFSDFLSSFGLNNLILKFESSSQEDQKFLIHYKFVGLTEIQQKKIRLLCRKLWNQKNNNKEATS